MKYEAKKEVVYHNNKVYHPFALNKEGKPKIISENPDGTVDIMLTFVPNGTGCISEYDLNVKSNVCA